MKISRINPGEMHVAFIPGTRDVRLLEDFVVETTLGKITIPEGFISDGASIPRAAWAVVSPYDPGVREAAVVHDWFYRESQARLISNDSVTPTIVTRAMADRIFYEELLDGDIPNWKAYAMYGAVRGFGNLEIELFGKVLLKKSWRE